MNKYKHLQQFFRFSADHQSIYKLENSQNYIQEQIKRLDWNSYSISKHIPKQVRQDFLNICAFHNELARIEESTKERSLGIGKLKFWQDSIDQIFLDKPPREPLAICIHDSCKRNPLPKFLFTKMIQFRIEQVEKGEFANISEMARAAEGNRGTQIMLFLRLLRQDLDNPILKQSVELVAQSVGISDFIRRVPYTLQNYKLKLPEDIKSKHSVQVKNLWDRIKGKPKEELFDAILEVAAFARKHMIEASKLQKDLPPQSFRAFLHMTPTEQYLEQLEYYNFNIFEKAINNNSYIQLPMTLYSNSKKQRFISKEY